MKVILIAAVARNGVIGRDGKLPWHLPEDLKRFKRATSGHAVIMGRRTWESIGKPLPDRRNVVVTRNAGFPLPEGVRRADSLPAALSICREAGEEKAFVIGGASLYKEALEVADGFLATWVEREVEGDAFFPFPRDRWPLPGWSKVSEERPEGQGLAFVEYARKD